MIFITDPHFIHEPSNYFILNRIYFKIIQSFLLSNIIQSAQKYIQIIFSSYQQIAPNSWAITAGRLIVVSEVEILM